MKNLLVFIFLSVFSFIAFGQKEAPEEQMEAQAAQETEAPEDEQEALLAEEVETTEEEQMETQTAQEAETPEDEQEALLAEEAETPEDEQMEAQAAQEVETPDEKEQVVQEPVASEEKPKPVVQASDNTDSEVSVQAGVKYECDGNKSYTLHEPGVNSESNLCELDAGHTETPADWYALHEASFCRKKLQEMVMHYNCVANQ